MNAKKNNPDYPYEEQTVKCHEIIYEPGKPLVVGKVIKEIPYSEYLEQQCKAKQDCLDDEDDYEWFTQHGDD